MTRLTEAEYAQIEAEERRDERSRMAVIVWVLGAWTVAAAAIGLWLVLRGA